MSYILWTISLVIVLCFLLLLTRRRKQYELATDEDSYSYNVFFVLLFALLLIVVEGFRSTYADTDNYRYGFRWISDSLSDIQASDSKGWDFLQWCLKKICKDSQFIFIATAFFIVASDVSFIRKHSTDLLFSLFLYFLCSFIGSMNGIRQITAACIMMLAFPWVMRKRTVPYLLLILLLSTIHKSILVVIPLYFIFSGKRWNVGLLAFLFFCLFSVAVPGPINALVGRFFADDYASYLVVYTHGANYLHVLIDGVPLVLGLIYHYNHRDNVGENRAFDVLINMQAVSFGFMLLATTMAQYARVGMYMRNATALVVPFLIRKVVAPKDRRLVIIVAALLYFIVFAVEIYSGYQAGSFVHFYLDFSIFNNILP